MKEGNDEKALREKLACFLEMNPEAGLERSKKRLRVVRPWNDASVALEVSLGDKTLISALNSVRLPRSLVALWHADTKDLEIIYTPFPIDDEHYARQFNFHFKGKTVRCEFSDASERMLALAEAFLPVGEASDSRHRNLEEFKYYLMSKDKKWAKGLFGRPTCFWIRNIEWDEEVAVNLCRHLNFYMYFYDRRSPIIIIVEPEKEEGAPVKRVRYLFDTFPEEMSCVELQPYLLILWESARNARDPLSEFLYYYQIIEYSAFYYLQEKVKNQIKKILAMPHTPSRADSAARDMLDVLAKERMGDEAKIAAVICEKVDPGLIWKEIEVNKSFFANAVEFDGGFSVSPLIELDWAVDDFMCAWHPKLADNFRKIRNALVHSREARMAEVITPTEANYPKLVPWVSLLSVGAMQVMVLNKT